MQIVRAKISNFRGIKSASLLFPEHVVLIGDNNVGKSTVLEAIDLCLGPDRLSRNPVIDEHDFHLGEYLKPVSTPPNEGEEVSVDADSGPGHTEGTLNPVIEVELVIIGLSEEQQDHFAAQIEWWNTSANELFVGDVSNLDDADAVPAIRVTFFGRYDEAEDDFVGQTVYSRSLSDDETASLFSKRDKQKCGFLYLRTVRTGSRALSLERGSLLDIILRLKEIRPRMWEETIQGLRTLDVATNPELGVSGVLQSVAKAMRKYVPKEWGTNPHLRVSNLTREHLRKVITAFISTGEGNHSAPFFKQGTGTINMLVLALLSQIAQDKQNVIFAMEEVETAIPPYAQKRIVHELRKLSAQTIVTSHSPYVLEEYALGETMILSRGADGVLSQGMIALPDSIKPKRYRQEFRQRFCEGLLSGRVLVAEGATEASSYPAVARRLSELNGSTYSSLEALGITVIDAGTDSQVSVLSKLYRELGKRTFATCDKQTPEIQAAIEAEVECLYMHHEHGFEDLVLANTTQGAMERFADVVEWPRHILEKFGGDPKADLQKALMELFLWAKGGWSAADFLAQCDEDEIPQFLREVCRDLKERCDPEEHLAGPEEDLSVAHGA